MGCRRGNLGRGLALLAIAAVALFAGAAVVQAELTAEGNLFVTFNGGIRPSTLPRGEAAPIAVWVSGQVRTLSGETPPSLRQITLGLNRGGVLDTVGLPTCSKAQIDLTSSQEALKACRGALVGSGTYRARTTFPEQAQTPSFGRILAFNTRVGGRPAILGHVYGKSPVPNTATMTFRITHPKGSFGTVLKADVPETLSRWGYLKRINLELKRIYTYKGRRRSYLSAPCPAPPDIDRASVAFAYASLRFDDGRTLSSKLTRTCRVRRRAR